ncbi:MAG: DNA (cytosine-5-)-methyltransferase [Clostridia bacterium]|nr:DNA (cytosine-5-)-methyltransferase [Clostridia bacterium]
MRVGSLFSGIGGMDLGLERAGMQIAWQVENDPFRQAVLAKHWPGVKRYGDIRTIDPAELESVDLICGGFPCQPFSIAGKRRGKADDRYLWPEMLRIIKALRPRWVLGENVANIVNLALDTVLSDLENEGYETGTFVIPACAVGAPHVRPRVWIVAYSPGVERQPGAEEQGVLRRVPEDGQECGNADGSGEAQSWQNVAHSQGSERQRAGAARGGRAGLTDGGKDVAHSQGEGLPERRDGSGEDNRQAGEEEKNQPVAGLTGSGLPPIKGTLYGYAQSRVGRDFTRLSPWLDGHRWPAPLGCEQYGWEPPRLASGGPYRRQRLMALGDAVVPWVVEVIGRAIMVADVQVTFYELSHLRGGNEQNV